VLVTGPTGSGKTTALYAALGHLRTGTTNIVSVEDPVERTGARRDADSGQRQGGQHVSPDPAVLPSPGSECDHGREMRDAEVAQIVGQAAYTGIWC
jgi:general secretion pathway protein E